ncbi:MAG: hypothetical protein ACR2NM_02435 [Bythopirellula sp.]
MVISTLHEDQQELREPGAQICSTFSSKHIDEEVQNNRNSPLFRIDDNFTPDSTIDLSQSAG